MSLIDAAAYARDEAARRALRFYGLEDCSIEPIQAGGPKALWKVISGGRSYALKRFRHPPEKVAFSVAAQRYARDRGAPVPAVVQSRDGSDFVVVEDQVFAVFEFVTGRSVSWSDPAQLRRSVEALARFHERSRGYAPPPGSRASSKLGRWPLQYSSIIERLEEWNAIACSSADQFCRAFAANAPQIVRLARFALSLLDRCGYHRWVHQFERRPGLCHQDFGEGNCIDAGAGAGVFIVDLDGVTFDLPARDIRKVLLKTAAAGGTWTQRAADAVASWFHSANPLTEEQWAVTCVDVLFPHSVHDVAKNRFLKGKPVPASKLAEAVSVEAAKSEALRRVFVERFGVEATGWPVVRRGSDRA